MKTIGQYARVLLLCLLAASGPLAWGQTALGGPKPKGQKAGKDTANLPLVDTLSGADGAAADTVNIDSINQAKMTAYQARLEEMQQLRERDSLRQAALEERLAKLRTKDGRTKARIEQQLQEIREREEGRKALMRLRIDSLRSHVQGIPVLGPEQDTLFLIYSSLGPFSARDRATSATQRILDIFEDDSYDFSPDSMRISLDNGYYTVLYTRTPILGVSEIDGVWNDKQPEELARHYATVVGENIATAREANSLYQWLKRVGIFLAILLTVILSAYGLSRLQRVVRYRVTLKLRHRISELHVGNYVLVSKQQKLRIFNIGLSILRYMILLLMIYIGLLYIFNLFPFTRQWVNTLVDFITSPIQNILLGIWGYVPNLFTILAIVLIMRYVLRTVKYFFREMEAGKLHIRKFHRDWAMPTYNIVRILLYAFTLILIFPYLPGSDSGFFKGVSVFLGVLFSLGSSTAISNMVAGLVITYMRPFRIGERIKIGEITGDVVEKSMLVVRLKTAKNEEITIPNSMVLSSTTTNYSAHARKQGLILHTMVTIGYDVPWPKVHEALIEAAEMTTHVAKMPRPFVHQKSLDDYYVAYELNLYTHAPTRMAAIYSELHANIQYTFAMRDIEIMSPHYRVVRAEGEGATTVPVPEELGEKRE